MKMETTPRGFRRLTHTADGGALRLVQESSAIGDGDEAFNKPGSSFLWLGQDHHLNREEVAQLVAVLQAWLASGRLPGEVPHAG